MPAKQDAAAAKAELARREEELAELKKKYDPHGFFRHNFWPLDNDGNAVGQGYNEPPSPTYDGYDCE